jgi:hypothetical protein
MKAEREIEELIGRAVEQMDSGSKFHGMSYEEGIEAALRWVLEEDDTDPMEG